MNDKKDCEHRGVLEVLLGKRRSWQTCAAAHSDDKGNALPQCIICPDCGRYVSHEEQQKLLEENKPWCKDISFAGRMVRKSE